MKKLTTLISILLICIFHSFSSFSQNSDTEKKSQTYAVVIGISNYESDAIPKLEFSHIDAQHFADFLKSEKGGGVSPDNIKLLTNEDAQLASILEALDWLKSQINENDQAIIYFSGHGDIETKNDEKLGYLLAYNSPTNNYVNNAISVKDINEFANAISLENKGKMVLILDACHSGVLAGDFFKGKNLVNKQLQTVLNNEVRLTACAANQEAAEGVNWGGGRGAFSYHLLNGLNGLAEKTNDSLIVLNEIQKYLDSAFVNDKFLIQEKHPQNPVLDGHPSYPLSFGFNSGFESFKAKFNSNEISQNSTLTLLGFSKVKVQPIDSLFNWLDTTEIEKSIDLRKLDSVNSKTFSRVFVDEILSINHQNYVLQVSKLLKNNPAFQKRFNERYVQHVHNRVQHIINSYLQGDLGELRRRDYYNLEKKEYEKILILIQITKRLVPEEHRLAHTLKINYLYLAGLNARINLVKSNKIDSLFEVATYFQNEALKLEPFAAYILNEIGVIKLLKGEFDSAEKQFLLASEIAPTWAIPLVNLISVYFAKRNPTKARKVMNKAEELQPNLEYKEINAGLVYELEKNWLAAESSYLSAIRKNDKHFLPFERLGIVNIHNTNFENAEMYFKHAKKLKVDLNVNFFKFGYVLSPKFVYSLPIKREIPICADSSKFITQGVHNLYSGFLGFYNSKGRNDALAISQIKSGLKEYPLMPSAHHILGKMQYFEGKWKDAQENLLIAKNNYIEENKLKFEIIRVLQLDTRSGADKCLVDFFEYFKYDSLENEYLLAEIFQKLGDNDKAIEKYKEIIACENLRGFKSEPYLNWQYLNHHLMGSLKLALLYEKLEKYDLAASTLQKQVLFNSKNQLRLLSNGDASIYWYVNVLTFKAALFDFYQRMITSFPRDYIWRERLGLWLFENLKQESQQKVTSRNGSALDIPFNYRPAIIIYENKITFLGIDEELTVSLLVDLDKIAFDNLLISTKLNGKLKQDIYILQALAGLAPIVYNIDTAIIFHNLVLSQEENLKSRSSLIELFNVKEKYPEAFKHLKKLDELKLLNSNQKIQFIQYSILSNEKSDVYRRMIELDTFNINDVKKNYLIFEMNSNMTNMSSKYLKSSVKAIYIDKPKTKIIYDSLKNSSESLYIQARKLSLKNKNKRAIGLLKASVKKGFLYKELLLNDPAFEKSRSSVGRIVDYYIKTDK